MNVWIAAVVGVAAGVALGMKYRGGTRSQCPKQ